MKEIFVAALLAFTACGAVPKPTPPTPQQATVAKLAQYPDNPVFLDQIISVNDGTVMTTATTTNDLPAVKWAVQLVDGRGNHVVVLLTPPTSDAGDNTAVTQDEKFISCSGSRATVVGVWEQVPPALADIWQADPSLVGETHVLVNPTITCK